MSDPDKTAALPLGDPNETARIPTDGADPAATMPIVVPPAPPADDPGRTARISPPLGAPPPGGLPPAGAPPTGAPPGGAPPAPKAGKRFGHPGVRALALGLLALVAASVAAIAGGVDDPDLADRIITIACAIVFFAAALGAIFSAATWLRDVTEARIGGAHAGALRVIAILVGGLGALLLTLDLASVPVGQLVLGGAVTGVIVGIAAQQSLANLFAGVVLLLARPFTVGDQVRLTSGGLGGTVSGRVVDIGLTYVRMDTGAGIIAVPNSQALGAVSGPEPAETP
ncbi:mechanosensitive ion channel domain-containing protein [Actinomycetes bacterium KLBMP 9797]